MGSLRRFSNDKRQKRENNSEKEFEDLPIKIQEKEQIYLPSQDAVVGSIYSAEEYDDDIYVTVKISSKHYFNLTEGYNISEEVLNELENKNINYMFIIEEDENDVYRFTLEQYKNGELWDESYTPDPQRGVPLEEYDKRWENGFEKIIL